MKLVSKKDMIFVAVIFLAVIVLSLFSGESVEVKFQEDIMSINATNFEFNIAYGDIASVELTTLPDLGTMEKGLDSASLKEGNWNNAIWGDYHLCVIPTLTNCVDVELTDGRHVVFNYKSDESTADVYSIIQEKLAG